MEISLKRYDANKREFEISLPTSQFGDLVGRVRGIIDLETEYQNFKQSGNSNQFYATFQYPFSVEVEIKRNETYVTFRYRGGLLILKEGHEKQKPGDLLTLLDIANLLDINLQSSK